jgi:hypothetical protein
MQLSRLVRNHRPRFNGNFPDLDLHCERQLPYSSTDDGVRLA